VVYAHVAGGMENDMKKINGWKIRRDERVGLVHMKDRYGYEWYCKSMKDAVAWAEKSNTGPLMNKPKVCPKCGK